MCAVACSMWWLGWIFCKTAQPEGSYQSGGTWSTGAALVYALTNRGEQKSTLWHSNKNKHWAVHHGGHGCSFQFFLPLSALAFSFGGACKAQSKQRSVNRGWNKSKRGLLWRVWWVSDRVWWTFLTLSLWCYFFSHRVKCFEIPHPGLTCWAMTTKQMASTAACGDLWTLGFGLPCREGLFEKPSWFNNISSPGAAKALSCLTPVAPSVELQHNCLCFPYILTQCAVVCHACFLDTWMHWWYVSTLWEWWIAVRNANE